MRPHNFFLFMFYLSHRIGTHFTWVVFRRRLRKQLAFSRFSRASLMTQAWDESLQCLCDLRLCFQIKAASPPPVQHPVPQLPRTLQHCDFVALVSFLSSRHPSLLCCMRYIRNKGFHLDRQCRQELQHLRETKSCSTCKAFTGRKKGHTLWKKLS